MVLKQIEEIVDVYRELAQIPSPTSAHILSTTGENVTVSTEWLQRDLERKEKVKFRKNYLLSVKDGSRHETVWTSAPQEFATELWNRASPSGKLRVVVRETKSKKDEEKQFIEIWDDSHKIKTVDVLAKEKHGKIYDNDGHFGSLEWSASEGHILYIAEMKLPKTTSYFDTKQPTGSEKEEIVKGDEYVFHESWGEQLDKKHHPVICVMDVETGDINVMESVPDDISPGQARWSPDDAGVVFVGWCHEPWRLGVCYCLQRKSHIYYLDLQAATCKRLSRDGWSARWPVFSPDMSKLIYLQDETGLTHNQCSRLVMYNWGTQETTIVIERISNSEKDDFPGLFVVRLASRVWCSDNTRVVVHTQWKSLEHVIVVNTDTKTVTRISSDDSVGAWFVLDVKDDKVIAQCSAPDRPYFLVIGNIPPPGQESSIVWSRLDEELFRQTDITWKVLHHDATPDNKNEKYPLVSYESFLLMPVSEPGAIKPPLIVFPHGGPHTAFSPEFALYFSLFCKCGFAVLGVNYRGSMGFGQDGIRSLVGNVGNQDVKDVQEAAISVIQSGEVDKEKVVVIGGSHGGFLTAHLIGQYPGFYKAAVARNPVINICSMLGSSDIPDWCYEECGLQYDQSRVPDAKVYETMWSKSPIRYADQVKTPTMIMLGARDRRCPPKQGEEYYRALKARNVPVQLLIYPDDCHPIIKMESESDAFVNIVKWFNDHLG